MKHKLLLAAGLIALPQFDALAAEERPDSVEIYTYSSTKGDSGLRVAVQDKNGKWKSLKGMRLTGSDFGAWGSGKKMFNPRLSHNDETGKWYLVFDVDKEGTTVGYSSSTDLISWTVQEYCHPADVDFDAPLKNEGLLTETIDGNIVTGTVTRVPDTLIKQLEAHQRYRKGLEAKYAERADEDTWRFKGIDSVQMSLSVDYTASKPISDKLFGIFFEDINYAADGGLYAELIQNRDFEYLPSDRRGDKKWHPLKGWSLNNSEMGSVDIQTTNPVHSNTPHYALMQVKKLGLSLINEGFDSINVRKGHIYNVSLWVNSPKSTSYRVSILDNKGEKIGSTKLKYTNSGKWNRLSGTITATADCTDASLSITPSTTGEHCIDMVSMMPQATYKGRANGLRPDIAQALADLKPQFVRFPGGCVAHGDGIDNIYDWKGSIGPLEARTGKRNLWGYHQTRGLGYHEYFLMCEDLGASPLPVIAAGVPCQNSSTSSRYTHDVLTGNGQQCGIPMEDMPAYIQDILDLIEYANGDVASTWGAKRAQAGHPEPFGLKMIGIGNEDIITDVFKERFLMIYNVIKEKHPEIEIIGTVGPFYEGADYDAGWEFARQHKIPAVDEHYYVSPGWLIHNGHFYDRYPRGNDATKVYLGEYASHLPDRASNMEAALSDALYLTHVERNADIVTMTSYAPLLAKKGHTQWYPDLIYFDNETVTLTPDYYVQKMYGNNTGTSYVPSQRTLSIADEDLECRLGQSVVIDETTGDTIIKLVNLTPVVVKTILPLTGSARLTRISGNPSETEAAEETASIEIADGQFIQEPYSFSVLRFNTRR